MPAANRPLRRALLFTFWAHALAMVTMALLLMPSLPGGGRDPAARLASVANHPWTFRLGWSAWGVTALSDLLLALAIYRTTWIPRAPALLGLLLTVIAIIPDQSGQFLWITRGVTLAQSDPQAYAAFEAMIFPRIAYLAAALYLAGALAWTWAFAAAGLWNRALTVISISTWFLFLYASLAPLLSDPPPALIAAANGVAFVFLQLWFATLAELLLRREIPSWNHGALAPWRHPCRNLLGQLSDVIANSRFLRYHARLLPVLAFRSEIADVIYVNYLLPADRLRPLVPPGLELDAIGPDHDRHALFTFLTFRHGHFRPALLRFLRPLFPSPLQSNWRIHVRDPATGLRGIYFFTSTISSTFHALAARLLSENMPMHVPRRAALHCDPAGDFHVLLDPGQGTAPDCKATLRPATTRALPTNWLDTFPTYQSFLAYCVPQDRALSSQPWLNRITRQEISLGIPLEACQPLEGQVHSRAAQALAGNATPVCFHVANVNFRFLEERR